MCISFPELEDRVISVTDAEHSDVHSQPKMMNMGCESRNMFTERHTSLFVTWLMRWLFFFWIMPKHSDTRSPHDRINEKSVLHVLTHGQNHNSFNAYCKIQEIFLSF
jgi:cobalamin biosynthesis Co2+ chelatase CbiK